MYDRKTLFFVFELLKEKGITFAVHSFNAVGFEKLTTEQAIDLASRGYCDEIIFLKERSDWDEVLATALEKILLCKHDQTDAREKAKNVLLNYAHNSARLGFAN